VPRQYGGLGNIDIPLLSDATHKIGRDYGVLVEEEGVSLRGMFIIDGEGLVQQVCSARSQLPTLVTNPKHRLR